LNELLGRCCAIGKVATNANHDPEKQAYNSANSVIRFCLGPDSADKNVARALNNELKEHLEKDAADNSDNSSKSFTSDFPEWHGCLVSGLTPELSRAAKRRRLERIVRADVTAEAAEPQAAMSRMTRESLTQGRATRRPRLEEPKQERRPTEAGTLAGKSAPANTVRRDNTRARTRRSAHTLGGGAPARSEAMRPKREQRLTKG